MEASQTYATPRVCLVKWSTPGEELAGLARFVRMLRARKGVEPASVGIFAPNRNWAVQMKRACEQAGAPAAVCMPAARLDAAAREALEKLRAEAQADSPKRGFALVRACGLESVPAFEHALLHVQGGERAGELHELIREQLVAPTMPEHALASPIMHYRQAEGSFEYAIVLGCVEGLIPGPAAFDGDETARAAAVDEARQSFLRAEGLASVQTVVSTFAKIDARTAEQARIRFARKKVEGGVAMAMCSPSRFLAEAGSERPSTLGGQAFLRAYNLN